MAQRRTDVAKVPIPLGVWAGQLVGRGGVNTRWLHIQSGGAHITVNDSEVTVRAKDAQVKARALQLVRRQLEAMVKFGTHETLSPSSLDHVLLEAAFGCDPRVRFATRTDEVAAAARKKDKLFELVPVSAEAPAECDGCGGGDARGGSGGGDRTHDDEAPLVAEVACWVTMASSLLKRGGGGGGGLTWQDELKSSFDQVLTPYEKPASASAVATTAGTSATGTAAAAPAAATTAHSSRSSSDDGSAAITLRFHAAATAASSGRLTSRSDGTTCSKRLAQTLSPAVRTLTAAARLATAQEPKFDVLKIRFHLGKHLFRNVGTRASRSELSLAELEGASAGRGAYQSVFSNLVPASAVPRVTAWLTGALGFTLTDTKTTASLHVINQELNVHYSIALAMENGDDSTACLRKVKAGGSRFQSVALLAAPDQLDLRVKLVTHSEPYREQQHHHHQYCQQPQQTVPSYDPDAHSTARRVAAAVRTEGFDGFLRSKRGLPRNRHLEYGRRKIKFVYEGRLSYGLGAGSRLRVSVTEVHDDQGCHFEISGCLPDVDAKLRQLLPSKYQQLHYKPQQQQQQQQQQQAPAPPPATASDEFVPEWRRRSRTSSGVSGGYGRRVYDSAGGGSRSPLVQTRAATSTLHSPTACRDQDNESGGAQQWAVDSLAALADFVTGLNRHLALPTTVPADLGGTTGEV